MTTRDVSFRDTKVHKSAKLDVDGDSVVSFATGPITHKPLIKFAWSANDKVHLAASVDAEDSRRGVACMVHACAPPVQHCSAVGARAHACAWPLQVNNETFHRMLEEYREAKRRELDLDLKAKQCVYCLSTLLQRTPGRFRPARGGRLTIPLLLPLPCTQAGRPACTYGGGCQACSAANRCHRQGWGCTKALGCRALHIQAQGGECGAQDQAGTVRLGRGAEQRCVCSGAFTGSGYIIRRCHICFVSSLEKCVSCCTLALCRPRREKKKSTDAKTAHDETKRRLESALRDQRAMAKVRPCSQPCCLHPACSSH